jgi:hypothetical protein
VTTCESILAILISPINLKVIACVSTILGTIINLIFLPPTVTIVVIILYGEVSSIYILI